MQQKPGEIDGIESLPEQLPVLPIRDLVVFPFMIVPLFVDRDVSLRAVDEALAGDRLLLLIAQRDPGADLPGPADLFTEGTIGKVLRMRRLPDNRTKILVQGLRRVRVDGVVREDPSLVAKISPMDEPAVPVN